MSVELTDGLARFLTDTLGGPVTVEHLSATTAGARRTNVLVDASGPEGPLHLVATILPTREIEVNPMEAEVAVRTLALGHGVPVPPVVGVCSDDSYVGAPFFVSERIEGETIPRRVLRLVHGAGIGDQVVRQLGEALGRLHSIDPTLAPAGLQTDTSPNPAEQVLAEAEQTAAELVPDRPVFALGLAWLERHLPPPPERPAIIHSDARNGNLIVGEDGLRSLLDWELARAGGDPMRDLAWPALRMWRFREDQLEIGGLADRSPFVDGYESAGGSFDADRFRWWKVFGTLGWGLGLAGQAAAHLDGRFRSVVMAASGRRVPELEWDLLMLLRPSGRG